MQWWAYASWCALMYTAMQHTWALHAYEKIHRRLQECKLGTLRIQTHPTLGKTSGAWFPE